MNIFWLDGNLRECAKAHADKHVVKMITEYTQLLNSAYYYTGEEDKAKYKLSHQNHPCAIWVRKSLTNWTVLRDLTILLYEEYQYRYFKNIHASGEIAKSLEKPSLPDIGLTMPPQCMPDECKDKDIVQAYRNYYNMKKQHIFNWRFRDTPSWIKMDAY